MTWVVLFVAGLFEVVWALALKESRGPSAPVTPYGRAPALLARPLPA